MLENILDNTAQTTQGIWNISSDIRNNIPTINVLCGIYYNYYFYLNQILQLQLLTVQRMEILTTVGN